MSKLMVYVAALVLMVIVAGAVVGYFNLIPENLQPDVTPQVDEHTGDGKTAFILVHGLGGKESLVDLLEALRDDGDVLRLEFNPLGNTNPLTLTRALETQIAEFYNKDRHENIVLVGSSMGALLVRRILLDAEARGDSWPAAVKRVVLMAGLNRGWDITGHRPVDMRRATWAKIWLGSWFGRLTNCCQLILSMESGTPFVANLRLDWMERMRDPNAKAIEVVQLLGDIDDIVSTEDNIDLAHINSANFSWIRVRGTGHGNIGDFGDTEQHGGLAIGAYRKAKFKLATTGDIAQISEQNVVQAFQPDEDVTDVVFVLHGIRDLGEWASTMEDRLRSEYRAMCSETGRDNCKLAIESSRYGYFGMGPFLLKPNRDTYVKWFMDEYTDVRAKYPNARNIHFFGHSNGTYLFAAALDRYTSLKIDRAVFAGSIVRQDYPWDKMMARGQVREVLNYQAHFDWVVATFPRFFEFPITHAPLQNDIGSAGFNGFSTTPEGVQNVGYIDGDHGAFDARVGEIARFIFRGGSDAGQLVGDRGQGHALLRALSSGLNAILLILAAIVVCMVGWRVFASSTVVRWPLLLTYIGALMVVLRSA